MKPHIVVIGASAGGVEALSCLLKAIPEDLNIAIFIVLHMSSYEKSMLGHILALHTSLPVTTLKSKIPYQAKNIYICPPDRHMLIDDKYVNISIGPKINGFRPSIEPLFTSAAHCCSERVIAILLTGLLYDGVLGLTTVKRFGGITVVQDPNEAKFADLPLNALKSGYVDYSLTLNDIANKLREWIVLPLKPSGQTVTLDAEILIENAAQGKQTTADKLNEVGIVTDLTCPECSGSLWEIKTNNITHFRCRIGHQYNLNNIQEMHSHFLENLLWAAIRSLEESGSIALRIANQFQVNKLNAGLSVYKEKAKLAYENANKLRDLITLIVEQE